MSGGKAREAAREARTYATKANGKALSTSGNSVVVIECLSLAMDATVLALSCTTGINATLALARSFAALSAAVVAVQACAPHNDACMLIDGHDGECFTA